jgi:hypothetical protein
MVSPVVRPMLVGLLLLAMKDNFGEVTIRTSRGKARCKFPYLARQLSLFFAPVPRWSCELQSTR